MGSGMWFHSYRLSTGARGPDVTLDSWFSWLALRRNNENQTQNENKTMRETFLWVLRI